jgi:hypothetical protein
MGTTAAEVPLYFPCSGRQFPRSLRENSLLRCVGNCSRNLLVWRVFKMTLNCNSLQTSKKFPADSHLSGNLASETGSYRTASSASQSCLAHKAPVIVEDAAIPRHMPRTTLSPCLVFGREYAITALCLRGQFLVSRFAELYSGSTVAERGALVEPIERYALQQPLDSQGARLAALDDRLDDIGGEISKPQETADMRLAESIGLRNLGGIDKFTLPQHAHP